MESIHKGVMFVSTVMKMAGKS